MFKRIGIVSHLNKNYAYQLVRETVLDAFHILKTIPTWFSSADYKKTLKVIKHAEQNRGQIEIPPDSNVSPDVVHTVLKIRRQGIFFVTWDLTKLNYLYLILMAIVMYDGWAALRAIEERDAYGNAEITTRQELDDDYDEPVRHLVRNEL